MNAVLAIPFMVSCSELYITNKDRAFIKVGFVVNTCVSKPLKGTLLEIGRSHQVRIYINFDPLDTGNACM